MRKKSTTILFLQVVSTIFEPGKECRHHLHHLRWCRSDPLPKSSLAAVLTNGGTLTLPTIKEVSPLCICLDTYIVCIFVFSCILCISCIFLYPTQGQGGVTIMYLSGSIFVVFSSILCVFLYTTHQSRSCYPFVFIWAYFVWRELVIMKRESIFAYFVYHERIGWQLKFNGNPTLREILNHNVL